MNITFLIGNGFDLNMGLNTRYSDFIEHYVQSPGTDPAFVKKMKEYMKTNKELWSNAEMAFGKSTALISGDNTKARVDSIRKFSDFHIDFCESMAAYLEEQQKRIPDFDDPKVLAKKLFNCLNNFSSGFRAESRQKILQSYQAVPKGFQYNFIVFNYTDILDNFTEKAKQFPECFGTRTFQNTSYTNGIGTLIHVHGTTKRGMVFGVNDRSQIANEAVFNDIPEEYLRQLIKIDTNHDNEDQTDEKSFKLLTESDLIYIYGMSLGATDKLWWERICSIMNSNPRLCLLIHDIDSKDDDLIRTKHLTYVRESKEKFVNYSTLTDEQKTSIKSRIYITSHNIFREFKGIATKNSDSDINLHLPVSSKMVEEKSA